ncbi:hypothetical protein VTN02DRAFT_3889 [Thermoascus thermophilus]
MAPKEDLKSILIFLGPTPGKDRKCAGCQRPEPKNAKPEEQVFKRCSRGCQKADWQAGHRHTCIFGALANNVYLDTFASHEDAFDRLAHRRVPAPRRGRDFRLRNVPHGMERARPSPARTADGGVRKVGILPSWWSSEKRQECEQRGMARENWSCLRRKVTKEHIEEHYKDPFMPMKLRILAEVVVGFDAMGR